MKEGYCPHTMHIDQKIFADLEGEKRFLNPNIILDDSISEQAFESRKVFFEAEKAKVVKLGIRCGDARSDFHIYDGGKTPIKQVPSIALGLSINRTIGLAQEDPSLDGAFYFGHCDGSTIREGQSPGGCGGLHAKELLSQSEEAGKHHIPKELIPYIEKYIVSSDAVAQTLSKAQYLSSRLKMENPDKEPITIGAMLGLHDSKKVFPLGFFKGGELLSGIIDCSVEEMQRRIRETGRIINYEGNNIPKMRINDIPKEFRGFLDENANEVAMLNSNPELRSRFSKSQKIQNPHTIYFSSITMPPKVAMPRVFENIDGNEFFSGFIPRNYVEQGLRYTPELIVPILMQSYYVLNEAIKNHKKEGDGSYIATKPFQDTSNFWINTSSRKASKGIVDFLRKQQIVQEFMEIKKGGVQLIASEMQGGIIRDIDVIQM